MEKRVISGPEDADWAGIADAGWRRSFRRALVRWYARHARDLPWRRPGSAYRIWVSEIMLQQTQVATVGPYFRRFIAAFPTVRALAAADEREVLRCWEGLGYYRRARQMHRAARQIVADHGGRFPRDVRALRALPGIGRYTAGAIASIAFDIRTPILESNSLRLLVRLTAYIDNPHNAAGQRRLWQAAEQLLPRRGVGTFNQALMELGSQVCTPRDPACRHCPLAALCAARAANLQDSIPPRKTRPPTESVHEAAVVVWHGDRVLLIQRGPDERWAGLWDFPRFPIAARDPTALERELIAEVKRRTDTVVRPTGHLATIRHGVTRFRITLQCHAATYVSGRLRRSGNDSAKWVSLADLNGYPLSATGRQLGRLAEKALFARRGCVS